MTTDPKPKEITLDGVPPLEETPEVTAAQVEALDEFMAEVEASEPSETDDETGQ